jgi:acetyl esterase/lipase
MFVPVAGIVCVMRLLTIAAIVCLPAIALAQRLLGVSDLASLAWPPPDHKIQYDAGPLQFGNLRLPKTAGPHPVVLFIHGGCWQSQYTIDHAAHWSRLSPMRAMQSGVSSIAA